MPPPTDKDEVWIPTENEFLSLVAAAESLPYAYGIVPWLWLRALSGLRPAESFFLEWADLDMENNLIWVRPKTGNPIKNRRKRRVPMHPALKPILLKWKQDWDVIQQRHIERKGGSGHQWVFFNPHDHDAQTKCFRRSFDAARLKAGLPQMNSYSLRHFFASRCIADRIDMFTISRWMGHRNTKMVEEVYGHLMQDRSTAEMGRVRAPGEDSEK
jgi:integrase